MDACGAPSADARVRDMGELLLLCRRFYLMMFEDGLLTARPESAAASFLAAKESGPAGDWPADAATQRATIAAKIVRPAPVTARVPGVIKLRLDSRVVVDANATPGGTSGHSARGLDRDLRGRQIDGQVQRASTAGHTASRQSFSDG